MCLSGSTSRRVNPAIEEFYRRLSAGKRAEVTPVACMRKMLVMRNSRVAINSPPR